MDLVAFNKDRWNDFVSGQRGSFLQSWEWGQFQLVAGRRVFRLAGGGWQAQLIETKLPGINKFYWSCPRGPVIANSNVDFSSTPFEGEERGGVILGMIKAVKKTIGKDVIFFRIEPEWSLASRQSLVASGFNKVHYDIEPSQTLILDITKVEEELLAQMHEKWRYNIRLAERKGVQVKFVQSESPNFEEYFDKFYELMKMTCVRQKVRCHDKEYYKKQLMINSDDLKFRLFVAEYDQQAIAANIVVFFNNRATYLHGASDNNFRALMAPHLLQWEQIREAKRQGCAEYDFWGFDEKKYPGVTNFKRGFGGQEVSYVGCWDYPLGRRWYWLYKFVQKIRR